LGERDYQAVALTHFFIDVLNSSRTLLVAILALSLGLSNTQVGLALLIYNIGNALTQPFFGSLADRIGPRTLVLSGMAWMIGFYAVAAVAGDWLALVSVTIAGFGSGAFHPSGTMVASHASTTKRTQATSVFFMAGQLGLFAGPILTGIILGQLGRPYYLILPVLALGALISGWRSLSRDGGHYGAAAASVAERGRFQLSIPPESRKGILILAAIILFTGTMSIATINFAPVLFTEMGLPVGQVGWLSGLLLLGAAVGGVVGGTLADRIGGRRVIIFSMLLAVVPLFGYVVTDGVLRLFLLIAGGFFAGMPHSIFVLAGQNLMPGRHATASGMILGYLFFAGSLGTFLVGVAADQVGLATALQAVAILPLLAVILTFFFWRPAVSPT
jgi:FSR family fosmidomycin resistance protein-like MFS transporter